VKITKTCFVIIMLISICAPNFCQASESSHRAAIEKMLQLTNVDKTIEQMYAQFEGILKNQFSQMGVSKEQLPIFEKYDQKMFDIMKEEMSWAKMRNDFIDIYSKVYTEEEIAEINKFYSSPAGKKMIEKMPILMKETRTITQKYLQTVLPKIKNISEEMAQEVKNSK